MQYLKMTNSQKRIKTWRARRNTLVGKMIANDPFISRPEALKLANKKMRQRSKENKEYLVRDQSLKQMGFSTYDDYLESSLWKRIRSGKLKKHNTCFCCKNKATCVHHMCYDILTLKGKSDHKLLTMCESCHLDIEFTENGKKRSFSNMKEALLLKVKNSAKKRSLLQKISNRRKKR